jgi:hypothetical protein
MNAAVETTIPAIGQHWSAQGGIYIGTRLIEGVAHHIVIPGGIEHDILNVAFADVEKVIPKEINSHADWRAPDQEDLMLAYINAREHFVHAGDDSIYWSRSVHHNWPWAVGFEDGYTNFSYRSNEFRVRPFRSFPDSSL